MEVLADPDPWLRACASLAATHVDDPDVRAAVGRVAGSDADTLVRQTAASTLEGGASVEAVPSTSLLERVMFLRKVPLFADLAPADLKHVGEVVTEHAFPDGEVIAVQGEPGDELYIVLEGEIRVVIGRDGEPEREVARRGRGSNGSCGSAPRPAWP